MDNLSKLEVWIEKLPDLCALAHEWRELEKHSNVSFFLSWYWIGSWLHSLPEKVEPLLIRIKDCGVVVALAIACENRIKRNYVMSSRRSAILILKVLHKPLDKTASLRYKSMGVLQLTLQRHWPIHFESRKPT